MSYDSVLSGVAHLDKRVSLILPNGDYVIYNPDGSGKPIVLSNVALEVYKCLRDKIPTDTVRNAHPELEGNWDNNLRTMMEFFTQEGLLNGNPPAKRNTASSTKPRKFVALWIHVTDICNLRCDYCYVHKGNRCLTEEACRLIVNALLSDVTNSYITEVELKFAGGEPLANHKAILYLSHLTKQTLEPYGVKVKLSIITNGTLVTSQLADTLKEMGFTVMVSLDGLGDYNNARRFANRKKSVTRVLRGVDILTKPGIRPTILTTVTDQNVRGLWELSEYVASKGLALSLNLSRDYESHQGLKMDTDLVGDELIAFLDQVVRLPNTKLPRLSFNGVAFKGRRTSICSAGRNYLAVDPEASVCFCQMTIGKPLGHTSDGKGFLEFANMSNIATKGGGCIDCIWNNVCCGGCGVLALQAGTSGRASVMCSLMKRILPPILMYEGRKLQKDKERLPCRT